MLRVQRVWASRVQRQLAAASTRLESSHAMRQQANLMAARQSSTLVSSAALRTADLTRTGKRMPMMMMQQTQRRWQSLVVEPLQGDPVRHKFIQALREHNDNGDYREALRVLDAIEQAKLPLDAEMYELTFGACARSGKVDVFEGLLKNMKKDDVVATTRTMDFLTQAYLAQESWEAMVTHLYEQTKRGTGLSDAAFQAGMEACGMKKDAQSAVDLLQLHLETSQSEVGPDCFASVIRACGMSQRFDLAEHVFNSMLAAGVAPNSQVLEQLIRSQVLNGKVRDAIKVFDTLPTEYPGVQVPEGIYTATIDDLVKRKEHFMAMRMFDRMHDHGVKPSFYCYGRIMTALVRMKRTDEAIRLWDYMIQEIPDEVSIGRSAFLLRGLGFEGANVMVLHIFDYLRSLSKDQLLPVASYTAAIRAYGRLGKTEQAVALFNDLIQMYSDRRITAPGPFLATFNALSRDDHRDPAVISSDAKRVWSVMVNNMSQVLVPAYASAAGVFASCGDMKALQNLLNHADENLHLGIHSDVQDDNEENDFEDYEERFEYADPQQILYNGVISGFYKSRSDCTEQIDQILEAVAAKNISITDPMIRAASIAYVEYERWDLMAKLLTSIDIGSLTRPEMCLGDLTSRLLDSKQWEMAEAVLTAARKNKLSLPIREKRRIITELAELDAKYWHLAFRLAMETLNFRKLIVENVETITDAVEICIEAGRVNPALSLYHQTIRRKLPFAIPLRLYKVMVHGLLRESSRQSHASDENMMKAEEICARMLREHQESLDNEALSLAISIKAVQQDDDEVIALFETMLQHKFVPNSYALKAAISAYSRAKMLDRVEELRDMLVKDPSTFGVEEDNGAYQKLHDSFVLSFVLGEDYDRVKETVNLMDAKRQDAVVEAFLNKSGQLGRAVEFLDPQRVHVNTWLSVLQQITAYNRKATASGKNFAATSLSSSVTSTALEKFLHGFSKSVISKHLGIVLENCSLLVEMGEYSKVIKIVTPLLAMQLEDLRMNSMSDETAEVAKAKKEDMQQMFDMLFFSYGEKQDTDGLLQLCMAQERAGFTLEADLYETAMQYCYDNGSHINCLKFLQLLRNSGVKPNGKIYMKALLSCVKTNKPDTAILILNDVKREECEDFVISQLFSMWHKWINRQTNQRMHPSQRSSTWLKANLMSSDDMTEIECLVMLMLLCHRRGLPLPMKLFREIESAGYPGLSPEVVGEIEVVVANAPRFSSLANGLHRTFERRNSF